MNSFKLYWRLISFSIRSQMEYPLSFSMLILAAFFNSCADILGIWVLFDRFSSLQGWHFAEVGYLYGMIRMSLWLADCSARGFDTFGEMIKAGTFDTVLLRPRSTALQIAGSDFRLVRVGSFLQGVVVLIWCAFLLGSVWTVPALLLTGLTVLCGACLFFGLFVAQATLAFWTTDTLEAMNILTFGGSDAAQYPISIYAPWLRHFFTFVVPMACVSYYPMLTILQKTDPGNTLPFWVGWLLPLAGVAFLILSLQFWKLGVRHYRSTGS